MRIVIDTNVWVSGMLWRGAPWRLLRLAEQGEIDLCVAPPMLGELARVLSYICHCAHIPRAHPFAQNHSPSRDVNAHVVPVS